MLYLLHTGLVSLFNGISTFMGYFMPVKWSQLPEFKYDKLTLVTCRIKNNLKITKE